MNYIVYCGSSDDLEAKGKNCRERGSRVNKVLIKSKDEAGVDNIILGSDEAVKGCEKTSRENTPLFAWDWPVFLGGLTIITIF